MKKIPSLKTLVLGTGLLMATAQCSNDEQLELKNQRIEDLTKEVNSLTRKVTEKEGRVEKLAKVYDLEEGGAINQETFSAEIYMDKDGKILKYPKYITVELHNPENRNLPQETVTLKVMGIRTEKKELQDETQSACKGCPKHQYKVELDVEFPWPFSKNSEKLATGIAAGYKSKGGGCKEKIRFDLIAQTNEVPVMRYQTDFKKSTSRKERSALTTQDDFEKVDCQKTNCNTCNEKKK